MRSSDKISDRFLSRLLIAGITAATFIIGWRITGVPYALLRGILTGVLTIVSYMAIGGGRWRCLLSMWTSFLRAAVPHGGISLFGRVLFFCSWRNPKRTFQLYRQNQFVTPPMGFLPS